MKSFATLFCVLASLLCTFCVAVAKSQSGRTSAGRIKLYTQPASPPCRAVMMVARALNLDVEIVLVNLMNGDQMKPEFLKINPQHSVPTIDDSGFILWESRAIMAYFVNAYGKDDALYPKNPKVRAVVDQLMNFDLGMLYSRMLTYYMPSIFKGETLEEGSKSKVDEALGYLDKLVEGKSFAAGDHLSLADFTIIVTISDLENFGYDLSPFENIIKWFERTKKALEPYGYIEINEAGSKMLVYYIYGSNNTPEVHHHTNATTKASQK